MTESGTFTDSGFFLRAVIQPAGTQIAVTFPTGATPSTPGTLQRCAPNNTCTGTPNGWQPGNVTTLTPSGFNNLTSLGTVNGGSNKLTAPPTVGSYVFSSWTVVANGPNPVNGSVVMQGPTTGCFSGWSALTAPTHVQANYILPDPDIEVEKTAAAEYFVAGGPVAFEYAVTNEGNVPLSNVGVTDSEYVGPTYQSGDTNNTLLDLTETWIFTGSYTPAFTVPGAILDNVATASGTYAATTVQDRKGFKLVGAAVRKAFYLYWQAGGPDKVVDYAAPGVNFTVDIYERGVGLVGTETVAEDDPLLLWLTLKPSIPTEPGLEVRRAGAGRLSVADARGTIGFDVESRLSGQLVHQHDRLRPLDREDGASVRRRERCRCVHLRGEEPRAGRREAGRQRRQVLAQVPERRHEQRRPDPADREVDLSGATTRSRGTSAGTKPRASSCATRIPAPWWTTSFPRAGRGRSTAVTRRPRTGTPSRSAR